MADLDAERIAAQRELAATREKQLEVAKRTEALEAQAAHYKARVASLSKGEAALVAGIGVGGAGGSSLPEEVLRSYAVARPPRTSTSALVKPDAGVEDQEARGAELTMARRKQQLSEQRMKEQLDRQTLNEQRLDLERQVQALEARRTELARKHKDKLAAATAIAHDSSADGVGEEGKLDGKAA